MKKLDKQFTKLSYVVAIHLERYDRQIAKLLAVEDYAEDQLYKKSISRFEFYKARERKIKAYLDAITTIQQKEQILQLHKSGFELQVIDEKIQVWQSGVKHDISKLSFEQVLRLYELMKKAKKLLTHIEPITGRICEVETKSIEPVALSEQVPNINLIKHEQPVKIRQPFQQNSDPTFKLRESLIKLAAQKFKEAGASLTEDEEILIAIS